MDDTNLPDDPERQSKKQLTNFSTSSTEAMKLASYHATLILGSYRADQASDPEIYVTAITHLLSRYPPDIGAQLTDPKQGVAGKYKWLPTVSEIKEEADRLIEEEEKARYREQQLAQQFELRKQIEAEEKAEPLEHRQNVVERIKSELRECGYRFKGDPKPVDPWKRFTAEELLALYSKKAQDDAAT